jgi:hypothetical protein
MVAGPRWAPHTRTDWPTDCRSQINFNFNFKTRRLYYKFPVNKLVYQLKVNKYYCGCVFTYRHRQRHPHLLHNLQSRGGKTFLKLCNDPSSCNTSVNVLYHNNNKLLLQRELYYTAILEYHPLLLVRMHLLCLLRL